MKWEDIVQIVLSFVILTLVVTIISVILGGCSDKNPARVAWLSVEKPPIKVIYIDEQGSLDPVITAKVFNIVGNTPYRNIQINNSTSVTASGSSHQSDYESDTDSSSLTIAK